MPIAPMSNAENQSSSLSSSKLPMAVGPVALTRTLSVGQRAASV
jgi:hypothetical protein